MLVKTLTTDIQSLQAECFLVALGTFNFEALAYTVNHLLLDSEHQKQVLADITLNQHLQGKFNVSKRYATSLITDAEGKVKAAKEARALHIKTLQGKLKSAKQWHKRKARDLKNSQKFYRSKKWQSKKTKPRLTVSCDLETRKTSWQQARFELHHKGRYIKHLERQIAHQKSAPIRVTLSRRELVYFVGSNDESAGNQSCQYDFETETLTIRVPYARQAQFGEWYTIPNTRFREGYSDPLLWALSSPVDGKKNQKTNSPVTYRIYQSQDKLGTIKVAATIQVPTPRLVTKPRYWGAVAVDENPDALDWAYVDLQGNLVAHGKVPLHLSGLSRDQASATIVDAVTQIALIALGYGVPIVIEDLDFAQKKRALREQGRRYARMLSAFAYGKISDFFTRICANRGIELIRVNPAYSSTLGLIRYCRMYGVSSGVAAAIVLARRAMRLSERLPRSMSAFRGVKPRKHVWSGLRDVNNQLITKGDRHRMYSTLPLTAASGQASNRVQASGLEYRVEGKLSGA